jgi:hypothetical protein
VTIYSQSGGGVVFTDAPGEPILQSSGKVVADAVVWNFNLQVSVTSGGQTVECSTVWWQSFQFLHTSRGKLKGPASSYVVGVAPFGGQFP